MTVQQIQSIFNASNNFLSDVRNQFEKSKSYYAGKNDIEMSGAYNSVFEYKQKQESNDDPLRRANNRVSSNFYQLLVDQEAGYIATNDPTIDVGDDDLNEKIKQVLGDSLALTIQNLIVDVSNAGIGWIHYWNDSKGNFKYAIITPDQIYPIYADNLENEVVAVARVYQQLNQTTAKYDTVIEYWNEDECSSFVKNNGNDTFIPYNQFSSYDISTGEVTGATNVFKHGLGTVPFIKFKKNLYGKSELQKVKGSIDVYDRVYNGFANDLQDIQQTLVVLKSYGGTNLDEFMDMLKKYKAINVDSDGDVDQLKIDIPVEARKTMLEITKQKIFDEGQGIDPDKFMDNGALSGKAVKGLYAHLDLKATTTEKNFREGLALLIRAILVHLNVDKAEIINISQTWYRNAIQDELEKSQAIAQLAPYMSKYAIARANPFVDDVDAELQHQQDERVNSDGYGNQSLIDKYAKDPEEDNLNE